MRFLLANQATASKRRAYFDLRDSVTGLVPAVLESGGQPQISTNGAPWTATGIGVLTHIGFGRYYATLTQAAVATAGDVIETRYKSSNTVETPGDSFQIVAFDPDDAAGLGLSRVDAAVTSRAAAADYTAGRAAKLDDIVSAAGVLAQVESGLDARRLDELLTADSDLDGAAPPTVGSVFHELMSKTPLGFTFDQTTDSLEAVRDNQSSGATAASIADAVWDEARSGHTAGGTFGEGVASVIGGVGGSVAGNVTGSVGSVAAGGITAASIATGAIDADALADGAIDAGAIAADAITAAKIADGAIDAATFAAGAIDSAALAASAITSAKLADGAITAAKLADDAITAAKIAANAIGASELAADAVTEIQAGLATAAAVNTIDDFLDTEIAAILADTNELQTDWANGGRLALILDARCSVPSVDPLPIPSANADAVWDEARGDHADAGTFGEGVASVQGDVTGSVDSVTGAVGSVTAAVDILQTAADKVWSSTTRTLTAFSTALALSVWHVLEASIVTASTIGLKLKTNVDALTSSRSTLTAAQVDTLLSATHGAGSWEDAGGAGTGANTVTITVEDDQVVPAPVVGAMVTVKNSAETTVIAGPLATDSLGQAVFNLANGTYRILILSSSAYVPLPAQTLVVSGTTPVTYELEAQGQQTPSDAALCLVYGILTRINGLRAANVPVIFRLENGAGVETDGGQVVAVKTSVSVLTNSLGYFEQELIRTSELNAHDTEETVRYRVVCPEANLNELITVPDASNVDLATLVPD